MNRRWSFLLCGMLWIYLAGLVYGDITSQDISETYCPICNMVVQPNPHQKLRGSQALYACEMAGHLEQLKSNPKQFVRKVSSASILPEPYINATMFCPVCKDEKVSYAVDLGPHGNQKIFACSEHHASSILLNPADYFMESSENDTNSYCQGATIMYDGFQSSYHGICPRLLFHTAILNSPLKYSIGFLAIIIMGIFLEYLVEFHDRLHHRFLQKEIKSIEYEIHHDPDDTISLEDKLLPRNGATKRPSLRFSFKIILTLSYMGIMGLAYLIMLIVMSYETGFFIAAILGLGLGFFFFRDVDQLQSIGNPDPCCST